MKVSKRSSRKRTSFGTPAVRLPRGWPENGASLHWIHGAAPASGARVHVWTSPTDTLLTSARLPTQSRAKIGQALPYALEEQLLEDPERLNYAYTPEGDGSLAVAVTARARIKAWTEALITAGVKPTAFVPANLALPLIPNTWSAAFMDNELWVRTGPNTGFACLVDPANPPPLLVTTLAEAKKSNVAPSQLTVYQPPSAFFADSWRAELGLSVVTDPTDFWREPGPLSRLNLLQSETATFGEMRSASKPLWPAAAMLAIWLVGGLLFDVVEWITLRKAHASHTEAMTAVLLKNFPETKTVLDPAAQMRVAMEALQARGGGPGDLLPLLTRTAGPLQTSSGVRVQSVKYAEHTLTLELALPDYPALDGVKNRLTAANLDVEVLAAQSRGSGVEGRLRVQPAKARTGTKRS